MSADQIMALSTVTGQPEALTSTGGVLNIGITDGGTAAEYETVAASQTAQVLGATGAVGDSPACWSRQPR